MESVRIQWLNLKILFGPTIGKNGFFAVQVHIIVTNSCGKSFFIIFSKIAANYAAIFYIRGKV